LVGRLSTEHRRSTALSARLFTGIITTIITTIITIITIITITTTIIIIIVIIDIFYSGLNSKKTIARTTDSGGEIMTRKGNVIQSQTVS